MKIIEPAVKMKSIDETASIVPLNKFRSWLRVEKKEKIIPWRTVEKSYRDLSGKEIKSHQSSENVGIFSNVGFSYGEKYGIMSCSFRKHHFT